MNSMYGLERENAELKKLREYHTSIIIDLNSENKALKESRDELLIIAKGYIKLAAPKKLPAMTLIIKKAEALKEKETK